MILPLAAFFLGSRRQGDSLVADPNHLAELETAVPTQGDNLRPNATAMVREGMDKYSARLHARFFCKEQIENQYTLWILVALAAILGIWVVAGLGIMSSVTAISLSLMRSGPVGFVSAPLFGALLTLLLAGFVGVLSMVHRARTPEPGAREGGFAGFAWEPLDNADQYPRVGRDRVPLGPRTPEP